MPEGFVPSAGTCQGKQKLPVGRLIQVVHTDRPGIEFARLPVKPKLRVHVAERDGRLTEQAAQVVTDLEMPVTRIHRIEQI